MRVLHVIPSLSLSSGGPSFALPAIARSLQMQRVQTSVVTTDDDGPGRRLGGATYGVKMPQQDGWTVRYFPKQTEFYKVSLPMRRWLRAHVADYDIVHVHALFSFASFVAARAACSQGVPYIIRPLGVLNCWGMENRRRWVKTLSFRLLELPLLKRAAAMHYTSRMELQDAARFHLSNRQVVIPIGMDLTPFDQLPQRAVFSAKFPETTTTRNILFLSRIDVKKGIDLLIDAFAKIALQHPDARLIICGGGDSVLTEKLRAKANIYGIAEKITWVGPVTGELRLAAFSAAELFVLPSHSENFGIALLEAMAAGLPCLSTDQVALAVDAAQENAVQLTARDPQAIADAIHYLFSSESLRQTLSQAGHRLARQQFSLESMGQSLHQLYREVTNRAIALPAN